MARILLTSLALLAAFSFTFAHDHHHHHHHHHHQSIDNVRGMPISALRIQLPFESNEVLMQRHHHNMNANEKGPFYFAAPRLLSHPVAMGSGTGWTQMNENGDAIWRVVVDSSNAFSMHLMIEGWKNVPHGVHFVTRVDEDSTWVNIYSRDTVSDEQLMTWPIVGNEMVLEVHVPASMVDSVMAEDSWTNHVFLTTVMHGYRPIVRQSEENEIRSNSFSLENALNGGSGPCNIDVVCPIARNYRRQRRAAVQFLTQNGQAFCSGSLLNNVRRDGRQLFLTAYHCIVGSDVSNFALAFNYERSKCNDATDNPTRQQTVQGLSFLAKGQDSDFALYEVVPKIPDNWQVYLAGWDATVNPATYVLSMHHPSGDVKKISLFEGQVTRTCWSECKRGNMHWQIAAWTDGTTEPGSSGSPLFSRATGRVIGQLHGGLASCDYPQGYDVYGAFSDSWNRGATPDSRLDVHLNPDNKTITGINGIYLNQTRKMSL